MDDLNARICDQLVIACIGAPYVQLGALPPGGGEARSRDADDLNVAKPAHRIDVVFRDESGPHQAHSYFLHTSPIRDLVAPKRGLNLVLSERTLSCPCGIFRKRPFDPWSTIRVQS
jgi:hypothetical protein